jgi:hypothetical protein
MYAAWMTRFGEDGAYKIGITERQWRPVGMAAGMGLHTHPERTREILLTCYIGRGDWVEKGPGHVQR